MVLIINRVSTSFAICRECSKVYTLLLANNNVVFQTMPVAMALLRDIQNLCPKDVLNFILDLIKYNDNRSNKVSLGCSLPLFYKPHICAHSPLNMKPDPPQRGTGEVRGLPGLPDRIRKFCYKTHTVGLIRTRKDTAGVFQRARSVIQKAQSFKTIPT